MTHAPSERLRRRAAILWAIIVPLAACQPGSSGGLTPGPETMRGPKDAMGRPTVRITTPDLELDASGSWMTRLENNGLGLRLRYANRSQHRIVIRVDRMRALRGADEGVLSTAFVVNAADDVPSYEESVTATLHDAHESEAAVPLVIPRGETRVVELDIAFADGIESFGRGQKVRVSLPLEKESADASFLMEKTFP